MLLNTPKIRAKTNKRQVHVTKKTDYILKVLKEL